MTRTVMPIAFAALLIAAGLVAIQTEAQDPAAISLGSVTTFDVPNAANTFPLDINAAGAIVGRYMSAGRVHGFMRSPAGDVTTIDYPNASFTAATSINDHGDIVGQYALPTAPTQRHGFLLKDGQFTSFDPAGSIFTNALGINERGDIVGRYCISVCTTSVGTGIFRGFLLHDGQFTLLDVPDALETDPFSISGSEQTAGGFLAADHQEQLFLLSNGEFTSFAPPNGPVSLDKGGINERGDVVGTYCDSAVPCLVVLTGTHGFLFSANEFTTIDIPGAVATSASGINVRGDIVGAYSDGSHFHGFLLSRWAYQSATQ